MGAGSNRMNAVTVQQTTQGLLRYLQQQGFAFVTHEMRVCGAQHDVVGVGALGLDRGHGFDHVGDALVG